MTSERGKTVTKKITSNTQTAENIFLLTQNYDLKIDENSSH